MVEVERDYIEGYALLKKCVVGEFYYEERWVKNKNDKLETLLGDEECITKRETNKKIQITKGTSPLGLYLIQVWGRRKILEPSVVSKTHSKPLVLDWPSFKPSCIKDEAIRSHMFDYVYAKDDYLIPFENEDMYTINPTTGSVSCATSWSISYCQRIGRDFVRFELKKLYEDLPTDLIIEINKFAISEEEVKHNISEYRDRNIGIRAKELIYGYLEMFNLLSELFKRCGVNEYDDKNYVLGHDKK